MVLAAPLMLVGRKEGMRWERCGARRADAAPRV